MSCANNHLEYAMLWCAMVWYVSCGVAADEEPSIESMSRYLCEKFCPNSPSHFLQQQTASDPSSASVQVSAVAAATGCSHRKILHVFRLLDSCTLVREVEEESEWEWGQKREHQSQYQWRHYFTAQCLCLCLCCQQVTQTDITPAAFRWLPRSRLDMMGRLEILFANLQVSFSCKILFVCVCVCFNCFFLVNRRKY